MKPESFEKLLNAGLYTGVPDSQLKPFCDYLMRRYGISKRHIICANEGNCVALAAGHYLATGKPAVVYMQNSGIGNIINPATSLMSDMVYGIPCIYVVGWRGERGVHDEPQHAQMGVVTETLLADIGIETFVIGPETTASEAADKLAQWQPLLERGKSVAFLVRKGAFEKGELMDYGGAAEMTREEAVELTAQAAAGDPIICTTGKASRELFEIRERKGESHEGDFLTVGSMGHSSTIALGIALERPERKVWCVDGDGAMLMHMGAVATIGSLAPKNYIHIVLNNASYETVGGMPTVAPSVDLCAVAKDCGYRFVTSASSREELASALESAKAADGPALVEAVVSIGSRADLGRPTISPEQSKKAFMDFLS